jgi:hypothetical protein
MVDIITPFSKNGMIKTPLKKFNPRNFPLINTAKKKAKISCGIATIIYHRQFLNMDIY